MTFDKRNGTMEAGSHKRTATAKEHTKNKK